MRILDHASARRERMKAFARRQRGFIINPFAYQAAGPTDPNWSSVVLLALMTGTNGGTTFTDSKARHTLTAHGNAQTSTAQSIGSYGSSGLFDGSGDDVQVTVDLSDFHLGVQTAFTIESWVYLNSLTGTMNVLGCREFTSGFGWNIDIFSNGTFFLVGTNSVGTPASTLTTGVWMHLAAVRASGNDTLYLDGTCVASASSITITDYTGNGFYIGMRTNGTGSMDGYMAGVRVTANVARYTGTSVGVNYFTPPTDFPTS